MILSPKSQIGGIVIIVENIYTYTNSTTLDDISVVVVFFSLSLSLSFN